MIKLVASDLDGTIIDKNNSIFANNFNAFEDLHKHNMNFVICTGKTYPIIKKTCTQLNASYGIFGNGNLIMDLKTEKILYKKLLTKEEIIDCINIAQMQNMHIHAYSNDEIITEKLCYLDLRNYKLQELNSSSSYLKFKIVNNIKDYILNNNIEIYKLVISSTSSTEHVKKNIIKSLNLSISTIKKIGKYKDFILDKEYEYLDITPKNTNKHIALEFLGKYLHIKPTEMLTIGDNLNDFDMIKNAGIGVAVANAYDEVKQVAHYTTQNPVEKGGFAEAVYKFVKF